MVEYLACMAALLLAQFVIAPAVKRYRAWRATVRALADGSSVIDFDEYRRRVAARRPPKDAA